MISLYIESKYATLTYMITVPNSKITPLYSIGIAFDFCILFSVSVVMLCTRFCNGQGGAPWMLPESSPRYILPLLCFPGQPPAQQFFLR